MKKILLSLIMIGLVSFGVMKTYAYFSDTETSTGNTFTAGTLNLTLDGGDVPVVGKFAVTNVKPGDSGTGYWTVANIGSIDGYLDLESKTVVNNDNGCNEPETATPDATCANPGPAEGELGANTNVTLFVDANHDGVIDPGDVTLYTGTLDGLVAATVADVSLANGVTKYLSLNWNVPTTVGNIIQSDGATLEMTFELGQTTGQ